jgi:hypothetical protein
MTQSFSEPLQKAVAEFQKQRDKGHVSFDVADIARAAHEGRVSDPLISEDTANADGDEDCLNAAALDTVLYGGRAFVLSAQEMPEKAGAVAVLRY